jgi:hypothetical protein
VNHLLGGREISVRFGSVLARAGENGLGRIYGRGQDLAGGYGRLDGIHEDEVGECAADVAADS